MFLTSSRHCLRRLPAFRNAGASPMLRSARPAVSFFSSSSSEASEDPSKPTVEVARACPREFYQMSNDMIIKLSAEGVFQAIEERLIREIMAVDGVGWDDAHKKFKEISAANQSGMLLQTLPYYAGMSTGELHRRVISFFLSFFLSFSSHYDSH